MKTVEEYIAGQPETFRTTLEQLRSIIRSVVPKAEEMISYQVPSFKHIYMLVGIGASKDYCSLYTMSPGLVKSLKDELTKVKVSGATLHFPPGKPLPAALVKKIVKARVKENEETALARSNSKKPAGK